MGRQAGAYRIQSMVRDAKEITNMTNRVLVLSALASLVCIALLPGRILAQAKTGSPQEIRSSFIKRFDRPRVPLDPAIVSSESREGLLREKLTVASEAGVRVPVLIVRKADTAGRLPAVVCLHGLGGSKEGMASYLEELARRGFVGVALDARYHGDRAGADRLKIMIAPKSGHTVTKEQEQAFYAWFEQWLKPSAKQE